MRCQAAVYFDPSAATHPGWASKNWFYYWKYALFGNVANIIWNPFRVYGFCNTGGGIEIGEGEGRSSPISNPDYATPFSYSAIGYYARPTMDGKAKIDLFFSTLTHELKHREDFAFMDVGTNSDSDHLPDNRDPYPGVVNGANYGEYTGNNAWLGDWEYNARGVEDVTAPADRDWSMGGKQW